MERSKGGELPDIDWEGILDVVLLLLVMTGSQEKELSNNEGIVEVVDVFMLPKSGDLGNETFDPDGEETLHSLLPLPVLDVDDDDLLS